MIGYMNVVVGVHDCVFGGNWHCLLCLVFGVLDGSVRVRFVCVDR